MARCRVSSPRCGEPDVHGAAVARAGGALDEPLGLDAVDEPGGPARGVDGLRGERGHGQVAAVGALDPEQHLEPGQRQADRVLEGRPELALEPGVGLEQEAEQHQAVVGARARRGDASWCGARRSRYQSLLGALGGQ